MRSSAHGFTLIELSMMMIIVGLAIGGIVVGRSLIEAATLQAQIGQIQQFRTITKTFQTKYGGLPGDLSARSALARGLAARTLPSSVKGGGNENGRIETYDYGIPTNDMFVQPNGELNLFWADLSLAGLLPEKYNCPQDMTGAANGMSITSCYPSGKIGSNPIVIALYLSGEAKNNFLLLSAEIYQQAGSDYFGPLETGMEIKGRRNLLTPTQAASIDGKIDDGLPGTGSLISRDGGTIGDKVAISTLPPKAGGCIKNVYGKYDNRNPYDASGAIKDTASCVMSFAM